MKSFSFRGIKGKLLSLVMLMVIGLAVTSVYSGYLMNQLKENIQFLGLERIPISDTMGDIRSSVNGVPRFMWLSLAYKSGSNERKQSVDKANDNWALLKKSLEKYEKFNLAPVAQEKLKVIKELMPQLTQVIEPALVKLMSGSSEDEAEARSMLLNKIPPVAVKITSIVKDLCEISTSRNAAIVSAASEKATHSMVLLIITSTILTISLIIFGVIFANKLSNRLFQITESVEKASDQVTSASKHLSTSADRLSGSSQEQASSIEETSSSLTEISSMVDQNVKAAEVAYENTKNVLSTSTETKEFMVQLTAAMDEILKSNDKITNLVKVIEEIGVKTEVIDDIVFKTQLLAFNASVEAERAGDHGRGFAVVAKEVGNLAQLSGQAATDISSIVKTSIKEASSIATENKDKVSKGGELATITKSKSETVLKQCDLIIQGTDKILTASKEQSQGINQISIAVNNLNKVTQDTAATSEETASASTELSEQAQSLKDLVSQLFEIVSGQKHNLTKTEKTTTKKIAKIIPLKKKPVETFKVKSQSNEIKKVVGGADFEDSDQGWEKI